MVNERKQQAITLRLLGYSVKSIAKELHAAQSSVSLWVREVKLTEMQTQHLRANTHTQEVIEKRRQARLKSELAKRRFFIEAAKKEVGLINKRELQLIGAALYWAEGAKKQSTVQFSNGDPNMIMVMMRLFRDIFHVDESKLRGCIHIHEHLDVEAAEKYWQTVTGISASKFYKTYNKPNKSSKGTRNSLPYGVCDIYVHDVRVMHSIKGWTEGIYESVLKMV